MFVRLELPRVSVFVEKDAIVWKLTESEGIEGVTVSTGMAVSPSSPSIRSISCWRN